MSRATSKKQQPAVTPLSVRQIAQFDKAADDFLRIAEADKLAQRAERANARKHKNQKADSTPESLLKNDRKRERYGCGIKMPPADRIGKAYKEDAAFSDTVLKVDDAKIAEAFRGKEHEAEKQWGNVDWAAQSGFGDDPADILESIEEYELAGGDAAAEAEEKAEAEAKERRKRYAISLLKDRDQERVLKFLAGVSVLEIAEAEGKTDNCIYTALNRSAKRIDELLEYQRQCKIAEITGCERPELPEVEDGGATPEQLELFGLMDGDDGEVQP